MAAAVLLAPACAVNGAAAATPASAEMVNPPPVKINKAKIKTVKAKTAGAQSGHAKSAKKALAAKSGKKPVIGKSKHHAKAKREAPVRTTGSIAPGSVPTPGLY